jgi:hypothetical protein
VAAHSARRIDLTEVRTAVAIGVLRDPLLVCTVLVPSALLIVGAARLVAPGRRLSDVHLRRVERTLLEGAGANGFVGELWTLDRIAAVIERLTGVWHHPAHVWALLHHRLGWSVQRPTRRAAERDQAAIDRWVKQRWPRIKQTVSVWACGPGGSLSGSGAGIAA